MRTRGAWSDAELKRLAEIVASGATPLRAAAALKRNLLSCKNQARKLGTPFTPLWKIRKAIREKCEAAEKDLAALSPISLQRSVRGAAQTKEKT
jgi:hypothetical protein